MAYQEIFIMRITLPLHRTFFFRQKNHLLLKRKPFVHLFAHFGSLLFSENHKRIFVMLVQMQPMVDILPILASQCEGLTRECWPDIVAIWTVCSEVCTKTIQGLLSFVWKRSVWKNLDQEENNQNVRIYLQTSC